MLDLNSVAIYSNVFVQQFFFLYRVHNTTQVRFLELDLSDISIHSVSKRVKGAMVSTLPQLRTTFVAP